MTVHFRLWFAHYIMTGSTAQAVSAQHDPGVNSPRQYQGHRRRTSCKIRSSNTVSARYGVVLDALCLAQTRQFERKPARVLVKSP